MNWPPIAYGIGSRDGGGYAHPECWYKRHTFARYSGEGLAMGSIIRKLDAIPANRRRCEVCREPITEGGAP